VATWAYDTGAYFVGSKFGKRRFLSHISPHKTYAGALGGFVPCLIVSAAAKFILNFGFYHILILGVLISLAAQAGDLAESLFKREAGAKDSGVVIPGHGGILDRIDSLLFTMVVGYYYAIWLLKF